MLMMGRLARFGESRIWDAGEKRADPQEESVAGLQTLLLLILVGKRAASRSDPA